ncbi:hypothetical protein ABKV35_00340 [Enterobacter kobei]|uniref:hypothetical protein n=1 Tax=Enterobacter kobei TaxID=208224 RepID=UPI0032AF596A
MGLLEMKSHIRRDKMALSSHSATKWIVRLAGVISLIFLVSGLSWQDQSLVIVEVLAIALWAETEYRAFKKRRSQ